MNEWPTKALKDLCDPNRAIAYGIVQPGKPFPGGIPIVRVNNFSATGLDLAEVLSVDPAIEKQYVRSRPQPSDVLITLVGSIGQVAIAPVGIAGWNLARAVGLLPMPDHHHAQWVSYSIKNRAAQEFIRQHANTTVQATFNLGDLAKLPIPYPDESVRQGILETLTAIDDRIELNRRMNGALEGIAQAIFRDWFVDFGPVRRRQAGATDAQFVMGGLNPDPARAAQLAALFPSALDADGLPVGWRAGTLGDIAEAVGEIVNPTSLSPGTPYFGLEHLPRCSITLDDWGQAGSVSSNKAKFKTGQVLFGKLRPYFHKVGIAPLDGVCSTDIVVMDAGRPSDRPFVVSCVSSKSFVDYTDQGSTGTKMPRTSWGQMKKYPVTIATDLVRDAYSQIVQPMHDKIIAAVHECRNLAETRDYLLPRLMSGAVRVAPPSEAT